MSTTISQALRKMAIGFCVLCFAAGVMTGCSTQESGNSELGHEHDHDHDDHDHDHEGSKQAAGEGDHHDADGHDDDHHADHDHGQGEGTLQEQTAELRVALASQREQIRNASADQADEILKKIELIEARLVELDREVSKREQAEREGHDKHDH